MRVRFLFAFVLSLLLLGVMSCTKLDGLSPTAPTNPPALIPITPTTPTVMAPPPLGLDPAVWKVGFLGNQLYRSEVVHLDISAVAGLHPDIQGVFDRMASVATSSVGGRTTVDTIVGGPGATFVVTFEPCDNGAAACTYPNGNDDGKITGGRVHYSTIDCMRTESVVLHEIYRSFGVGGLNPKKGVMSSTPWLDPRPSDEEQVMLLGRYDYPLLSVYSAQ